MRPMCLFITLILVVTFAAGVCPAQDTAPPQAGKPALDTADKPAVDKAGEPAVAPAPEKPVEKAGKVAVITIHGNIDYGLQKSLERRKDLAIADGAELIVFEMDTYGGALGPAIEIGDLVNMLKTEAGGGFRTVAYVHKKAISAGALISIACQEIVMRRDITTIGDCQPIQVNPQTRSVQVAPEKAQTMVRATMRKYAQSNGYPVALCEAMVDQEMEVRQIKFRDGSVRYLAPREIEALKTTEKDDIEENNLVVSSGQLLTMSSLEAEKWDFSRATVDSEEEAIALYATTDAKVMRYETNWSEEMVRFLNSMAVASLLMTVGLIALYMAFKVPGFGVAEITAICCFSIVLLSKYLVGLATVPEIIIFFVGLTLLAVEVFVIPGFGVVGITGLLCIVISLILSFQSFTLPKQEWQVETLIWNMLAIFGSLFGATVLFMIFVRFMPRMPVFNKLVLATTQNAEEGYVVGSAQKRDLVGKTGVVRSTLRPSGRAEIDGENLLVVADQEFIEPGTPVVVCEVRGNQVVVKRA